MLEECKETYEAWRAADAQARHMERMLAQAWKQFSTDKAAPPSDELLAAVSRLRAHANDKLTAAMLAMSVARRDSDARGPAQTRR
jgi:hypothetical protein